MFNGVCVIIVVSVIVIINEVINVVCAVIATSLIFELSFYHFLFRFCHRFSCLRCLRLNQAFVVKTANVFVYVSVFGVVNVSKLWASSLL